MTTSITQWLMAIVCLVGAVLIFRYCRRLWRWGRAGLAGIAAGFGLAALALETQVQALGVAAGALLVGSFVVAMTMLPLDVEFQRRQLAAAAARQGAPEFTVRPLAAARALRTAIIALGVVVLGTLGATKAAEAGAPLAVQVLLISATVLALVVGPIKLVVLWFADFFEHDELDDDLAAWTRTLTPQAAQDWTSTRERITARFTTFRSPQIIEGNRSAAEGGSPRGSAVR